MLINNNTQAISTVQQLKRADMDPANAAASTLYSGALQAAQQSVTVPAAQKDLDKANDRIDEAFAKTRVQLQATTAAPAATTDVPAAGSSTSTARADFTDYMNKTPAERIREQLLKEQGLTEEEVQAMPQEKQDAIAKQVAERVKEQQDQQVAAKATDPAQAVKETLAAI
ncbi:MULTISPECIES: hypothetical protein [unclassified Pseudomonas]|jgi:TPP-dependent pyruvate/acetoin dehydrogenase alpha subunit|uniref:hypothetical protein n=1 Tax=unclassified Pseudomonas TaxID=196821 RepID=UPI000EE1B3ED|nr:MULTISPECIES: hypothetical protein [unclassified Pseudomonas]MCS4248924.1 TPP-dependent pyruvate/acetoin dehydrogenase alpha subunit [Pseudomonas sp. BIGb0164]NVZ48695.1 hypothetical protein [Pseudomonas sp. B6002]NWE22998.1 hypothetical protein [Pseudomonas sp. P7548]HCT04204.1 hypothetical protein [Pseudomonas sp.]